MGSLACRRMYQFTMTWAWNTISRINLLNSQNLWRRRSWCSGRTTELKGTLPVKCSTIVPSTSFVFSSIVWLWLEHREDPELLCPVCPYELHIDEPDVTGFRLVSSRRRLPALFCTFSSMVSFFLRLPTSVYVRQVQHNNFLMTLYYFTLNH